MPGGDHSVLASALIDTISGSDALFDLAFTDMLKNRIVQLVEENIGSAQQKPYCSMQGNISTKADSRRMISIGIDDYGEKRLASCAHAEGDAVALLAQLEKRGYEGRTLLGGKATCDAILSAVEKGCESLGAGDILVIFFSGYGITMRGRLELLTANSCFYGGMTPTNLIDLGELSDKLDHARADTVLICDCVFAAIDDLTS